MVYYEDNNKQLHTIEVEACVIAVWKGKINNYHQIYRVVKSDWNG